MKILKNIKENKIFFITFGMLMYTSFAYLVQKEAIHYIDNYYFPLYVINYDCGYCSRLLIGSVLSLFFGDKLMTPSFIVNFLIMVYILSCFLISLFINNYLKKTKYENIGIYSFFLIITPVMLAFLRFLGTLDLFFVPLVLASVWLVDKKGWRWLVPVFCAVSLCIYELFATTYLPIMAIIVFYQFVKKPNTSNFIYIAVCAVVVGAASVYFLIIGDNTMKMTSDQMVDFARNRLDASGNSFDEFYLRSVFFWEVPDIEGYEGFAGYIKYNFDIYTKNDFAAVKTNCYFILSNTISALPFFYLIGKALKKAENPLKKFIFFCCFSVFPLMIINLLLSTDTDRFSLHFVLAFLLLLLFFIKEKDSDFSDSYDEATLKLGENKIILTVVGVSFAQIVLSGVRF